MKRIVALGIFLAGIVSGSVAQQGPDTVFRFDDMTSFVDLESIDMALVPAHFFGEDIAVKCYAVQQAYTFVIKGTPSSPGDKTEVEKPVIYNNLKKLCRYYKKMVKKGSMTKDDAIAKLDYALDVTLSLRNQETSAFEDAIRSAKGIDNIAMLFNSVVLE